jgi:hypothetical protein
MTFSTKKKTSRIIFSRDFTDCDSFLDLQKGSKFVSAIKGKFEKLATDLMASPLTELSANVPYIRRRGPKPKDITDRIYKPRGPIKCPKNHRSRTQKIEILQFLFFYRKLVKVGNPCGPSHSEQRWLDQPACGTPFLYNSEWWAYDSPSIRDVAVYFKVPRPTLQRWIQNRHRIVSGRFGKPSSYRCQWPELEERLYNDFRKLRAALKLVSTGWFRRRAKALFRELYPESEHLFVFSNGWFRGFLRRHNISRRRITKQASVLPAQAIDYCNSFLKFIRRQTYRDPDTVPRTTATISITSLTTPETNDIPRSPSRRIKVARICNMDETPLPFEFLDGYTYDTKGQKTIAGSTKRSGWSKRQASLILTIWADSINRTKPILIFHGSEAGQIKAKEGHLYHSDVLVKFNPKVYNNKALIL